VGQDEFEAQAVNIRNRDDEVQGREEVISLDVALEKLIKLRNSRALVNKLE
jgi:threonyl-tRNA synthetase